MTANLCYRGLLFAIAATLMQFPIVAVSDDVVSDLTNQKSVAVTIYNDNLALIKDVRAITAGLGTRQIAFRDVSAYIKPETAMLRSLSNPDGFSLIEQNFDFDLLTPRKLLEKFVGKNIGVIKTNPTTGAETYESATLLGTNDGVVMRIGKRIETGVPGRMVFPEIPDNLRDRPTLTITLNNQEPKPQTVELSYLTSGLSWHADYVAELNGDESQIDLNAWVTLTNTSGTRFDNARLQLVAGEVNRATFSPRMLRAAPAAMVERKEMAQESLLDYHLYTLDRATSLAENQTKQVSLFANKAVPVRKQYRISGEQHYFSNDVHDGIEKVKVGVYFNFNNDSKSNLGIPLPEGIVRVYKRDTSDNAQFVGEDRIDHTASDEGVSLKMGNAFDITASRRQIDFKKTGGDGRYNFIFESRYEVKIHNAKNETVTVAINENIPGDWQVLDETSKHEKISANMAQWTIEIAPKKTAVLNYKVRVRY